MSVNDDLARRFWQKVALPDSEPHACWIWTATRSPEGYGRINPSRRGGRRSPLYAHRVSYELARGPIPDGLVIDHLCRNRACVNPSHLEAVAQRENVRRGLSGPLAVGGRCRKGHEISSVLGLQLRRGRSPVCHLCNRDNSARARRAARERQ